MERTSTASIKIVLGMFAALCAWDVYRAATCDVTPGEAWNYDRYIGVPWQESLQRFDANNHVLNTFLVRISTKRFHLTELSLRLPALLFGLLYLWGVFRLCRSLFGDGAMLVASVSLMTLNPLVLDALSEARGYGMAMAFWLWALILMLECLESFNPRKLNLAAACLALSVAACLTFIVPALGLLLVFLGRAGHRPALARHLLLPALIFTFVLLVIPLNHVLLTDFAAGATSLRQTLAELTAFSLSRLPVNPKALAAVVRVALALVLVAAAVEILRRRRDDLLALTAGTAWIGVLILLAAHSLLGSPFPQRGAIYFIPVLTLTALALLRHSREAVLALSTGCVLIYALGFPAGAYLDGHEYEGSRDVAKALRQDARQRRVRIASSLELEPVVNYYAWRYRQANWGRVERKGPEPGADYYVLTEKDAPLLDRLQLRLLLRERGIILAKR